ncbi:diguanylate cyclase domain-containing protein [Kurthia sibirica]|nr:diguanylate cyclase [Kurthia sibirica]GEK34867.1 hypothetical protein KSI01_24000 [Kurthia sibirica]
MENGILTGQQLHMMFEHCDDFVYYLEKSQNTYIYKYVNPATSIIFQDANPINQPLEKMIQSVELIELLMENYDKVILTQQQTTFRDFFLFSNTTRTNETTVIPTNNGQGILAITREIPQLKVLEEENHYLTSLFQNQLNAVLVMDEKLNIIKTNEVFHELFVEDALIHGKSIHELYWEDSEQLKLFFDCLHQALTGKKKSMQLNLKKRDHAFANFQLKFNPVILAEQVVAVSVEWIEYTKNLELKHDLMKTSNVLDAYKAALDEAANFCITDYNGIIEYVSPGYAKLAHFPSVDMIGKTNAIVKSRQQSTVFYDEMWSTIKAGNVWRGEICNMSRIGTHYWLDSTIVPMFDMNGDISNFLSICLDVTEKRVLMTNLRSIERTFRLITENTNDFIVITNEDGIILYVSPNHESRLGYEKEELLGQFYFEVLTDESNMYLRTELNTLLPSEGDSLVELQLLTKSGGFVWIEAHITVVTDAMREDVYQFVIIAREITQRKQKEDELRFMAYHDSLTLLPNRRFITAEFPKLVKQAINFDYSITLLYIDGDNFKRINDVYGHDIGDEFIKEFGQALTRSVRDDDLVARIGGDEFIIMLTHMSADEKKRDSQLLNTINRIQLVLRKGWMIAGHHFSPTSSIGVASYPSNGQSINELMAHADDALYIAKKINGKDSYHISSEK